MAKTCRSPTAASSSSAIAASPKLGVALAPRHQSTTRALRESPDFRKRLTETLSVSIERHPHAYNVRQAALNSTKAAKSSSGSEKGKERLPDDLDDEPGESHILLPAPTGVWLAYRRVPLQ